MNINAIVHHFGDYFTRKWRIREFSKNHEWRNATWFFLSCFPEFVRVSTSPKFRGCKVFTQFPNTSPSGKRVDSDDPFPRIVLRSPVKTLPSERRSVHGSPPKTRNGHLETVSWNYPPLPLKPDVVTLFHCFTAFLELLKHSQRKAFKTLEVR
jgi:hypothetical protein